MFLKAPQPALNAKFYRKRDIKILQETSVVIVVLSSPYCQLVPYCISVGTGLIHLMFTSTFEDRYVHRRVHLPAS